MATLSDSTINDVPPLEEPDRFCAAAYFGATEWVGHIMHVNWVSAGKPRRFWDPTVGATIAEDLITHGPALWERARLGLINSYYRGFPAAVRSSAEHRFWKLLCLRDLKSESTFRPWIRQEPPFLLSPVLVTAAAQARLTLERASIDEPLNERSHFDLPDLVAQIAAVYAEALAGNAPHAQDYGVPGRDLAGPRT